MSLRTLGKSDLKISPIGLGCWQFSQAKGFHKYFWKNIESNTMDEIVKTSFDNGINWFDTAELYGSGRSERALSSALKNMGTPNVVIATKWNPFFRRAKTITKTFHNREENLSPYTVDLHQIHNPYSVSSLKDQLNKMSELYNTGKIKAIGVSNFSTEKMEESSTILEKLDAKLSSNQVRYSIFDRAIETEGLIAKAKELGVTIIAYSPLAQGLATGIYHKNEDLMKNIPFIRKRRLKAKYKKTTKAIDEIDQMATELNCSIAQISLNWLINYHGETVVAIPGASKPTQALSNAKSMDITLSKEKLDRIDELTQEFL